MFLKMKTKRLWIAVVIVFILVITLTVRKAVIPRAAAASDLSDLKVEIHQAEGVALPEDAQQRFDEYGLEYFAYMDLDSAPAELHSLILEARSRIIYGSTRWVADGQDAYIKDKDGNIIEVLPHFHDLFPEDWEMPIRID